MTTESRDIVERLETLAILIDQELLPGIPTAVPDLREAITTIKQCRKHLDDGTALFNEVTELLNQCRSELDRRQEEIKFLRKAAGAVTDGPSFAEIAKDLPRKPTDEEVKYNPHPARTGYYGMLPK